jgi:hypothetical protein
MSRYPTSMAVMVALRLPAMAPGGLCENIQKTPPSGMFLDQVRRAIAEQAHRQEHLREPLRIDTIHKYFGTDAWHVICAEPQHSEMGGFLIAAEGDRLRHVALWGGVAVPEDEPPIFAWFIAKAPDAPRDLWRCVAHDLATREE